MGLTILDARSSEYSVALANAAFVEMTGHPREEIIGHNLRQLRGPDTDVAAMTGLRDALAEGRGSRVLLKNYRKDGTPFWNDLTAAPIVDSSDRLTHFVAVQHDVTSLIEAPEHRAALAIDQAVAARTHELDVTLARVEERRRFTETVLNSIVSGILATDDQGIVTFANRGALLTLGTSMADCVGRSVVELFGHNEGVAALIGGQTAQAEMRLDFPLITPGGARFYVGMSVSRAPEELRDEVAFIFLFRNLAETIEDATDPRLKLVGEETLGTDVKAPDASPPPLAAIPVAAAEESAGEERARRRRLLLALRYCSPVEVVRRAISALAADFEGRAPAVRVDAPDDLPEILVDRQQVSEGLAMLIGTAIQRCGGDSTQVRVRISYTEALGEKGVHPAPALRLTVAYPRALISEADLGGEAESSERQSYRRSDLAAAEKLLEANGGRLIRPLREAEEQELTVLLRAAK